MTEKTWGFNENWNWNKLKRTRPVRISEARKWKGARTLAEYKQMYSSTDGPLNQIHELATQLKQQLPIMDAIRRLQPNSVGDFRTFLEWADKILTKGESDCVLSWRKEHWGGVSLEDLAHYLYQEQFTMMGAKVLRHYDEEDPRPFDKETCAYWIDKLYVEKTYCGWKAELDAKARMEEQFRNGIMKSDGSPANVEVKIPDRKTDAKGLDLIVMEKGTDKVMFGVQVKPTTFTISPQHQENYDTWRYSNSKITIGFHGEKAKIKKKQQFETYLCIYDLSEDRNELVWENLDTQIERMWTGAICPHLAS